MAFDQGHALLIGVGSYVHHPHLNIPISVRDARAVNAAVQDTDRCGYPASQVKLLHDDSASRQGILDELDRLVTQVKPEHTVTVFYCGHGDYGTDGNYYLTTHDTRVSDNYKVVSGAGISEAELLGRLRAIPARRLLLLFNACHSGEVSPALGLEAARSFGALSFPVPAAEGALSTGEARIIITACRSEQSSWYGSGDLSFFTQALVDGLGGKGVVVNNHGYISAFSLYEHVYESARTAAQGIGRVQEAELTVLKGVGPFPVALFKGAEKPGAFDVGESLPPGTAARQVEPDVSLRRFQQITRNVSASGAGNVVIDGNANKAQINTGTVNGPMYNIQGGIHARRDVVMGNQVNNPPKPDPKDQ